MTSKPEDYTKVDAGATLHINETCSFFVKAENIPGKNIENLDDVYTVLDGEPFVRLGFTYGFLFAE